MNFLKLLFEGGGSKEREGGGLMLLKSNLG